MNKGVIALCDYADSRHYNWVHFPALRKILDRQGFKVKSYHSKALLLKNISLLNKADIIVTTDPSIPGTYSGKKRLIMINGPDERKSYPDKNVMVIQGTLACMPCGDIRDKCYRNICLEVIQADDIAKIIMNELVTRPQMPPAKISVCMITKDEVDLFQQCLDSIQGLYDELIVVLTEKDEAIRKQMADIAQEHNAKIVDYEGGYIDVEGQSFIDNFSQARNQGLQYATGDWLFIIDPDEHIDQQAVPQIKHLINQIDKKPDVNVIKINVIHKLPRGTSYSQSERFFRNGELHYEGRVHNQPVFTGKIETVPIVLYHEGYGLEDKEHQRIKYKRTEKLLKMSMEDDPGNGQHYQNLIRSYRAQNRDQDIIDFAPVFFDKIARYELLYSPQIEQLVMMDLLVSYHREEMLDKALEWAYAMTRKFPDNIDGWHMLATILHGTGQYRESIEACQKYIDNRRQLEQGRHTDVVYDTFGTAPGIYTILAKCHIELGELDQALLAIAQARVMLPLNIEINEVYDTIITKIKGVEQCAII